MNTADGGLTGGSKGGAGPGTGGSGGGKGTGGDTGSGGAGVTGGSSGAAGAVGSGGSKGGTAGTSTGGSSTGGSSTGGAPSVDAGADAPAKPAMLTVSPMTSYDFGNVEVGQASAMSTFTITNKGDLPTGALSVANPSSEVSLTNGCTGTLAAGATCTLVVSFKPSAAGLRAATLTLSSLNGGSIDITLSARGLIRLTITMTGSGQVTSTPAGITCGTTCTGLFAAGNVTLNARPTVDQRFNGWTGGGCPAGVANQCAVQLAQATTVKADFAAVSNNLVFETSAQFAANLGAPVNYDAKCNAAATAAGINDAAGTAFVALLSSSGSLAATRLGGARGWVRLDGRPFIDTLTAAFGSHQVFNSVGFDENGNPTQQGAYHMTGLALDGSLDSSRNCSDWSSAIAGQQVIGGSPDAGPFDWASNVSTTCDGLNSLLCMGKKKTSAVAPSATAGKRIWVSGMYNVGGPLTPDATCQASRPSGVTTAVALIATTTRAASALLSTTASYVRPDGTLVGTGAQLAKGLPESGVWQSADGSYLDASYVVWTGSSSPDVPGTVQSTCSNWADPTMTTSLMHFGAPNDVRGFWSSNAYAGCDLSSSLLYCIQTAP